MQVKGSQQGATKALGEYIGRWDKDDQLYSTKARPFLKWPGGKRQLLNKYAQYIPDKDNISRYFEPFVGGAAMFFHLQPTRAILSDLNADLITTYRVVRDKWQDLIAALAKHTAREDHFYKVRAWDRPDKSGRVPLAEKSDVERAARLIYLNRTAFNGLVRYNRQGQFNAPFGHYTNPTICDPLLLAMAGRVLKNATLCVADFQEAVEDARDGDFIYFDPPYVPISRTSSFTGYTGKGFGEKEQRVLASTFADLDSRGCRVMLSNSNTPLVRALYQEFNVVEIQARRNINSNGDKRGEITELLITNYPPLR